MAVLRLASNVRRGVPAIVGLVLALTVAGCVLAEHLGLMDRPLAFPHAIHVEEGLDCTQCHKGAENSDVPGWPAAKQCALCHDGIDEEKAPERRVDTLFGDEGFNAAYVTKLPEDVNFSHKLHVGAALECASCHEGIEDSKIITAEVRVRMDDCRQCHAESGKPTDCATCHTTMRQDVRPPNHQKLWTKRHGQAAMSGSGESRDNCELCHTESSCSSCHQDVPPENHNNHWRHRGHGIKAGIDRDNCFVCHRVDSCDRCHDETEPRNHTGSWGDPGDRHCLTCHFPLQNEGCFVCHKDDSSHLAAPPRPPEVPEHAFAVSCLVCHPAVKAINHPFTGDGAFCLNCHK